MTTKENAPTRAGSLAAGAGNDGEVHAGAALFSASYSSTDPAQVKKLRDDLSTAARRFRRYAMTAEQLAASLAAMTLLDREGDGR